jgi:hypothetical protein
MKSKSKFFLFLIYLAFLCCLLPVAYFTYKHPSYNFDMLGYMALVVRMDKTHNINEVHSITYESAKEGIPPEEYYKLTNTPSFRQKFATDPLQFEKLLPIYIVKPAYIGLSYLFYKMGFSLPKATVMPSILAYLILGMFLLYWFRKYLNGFMAFFAAFLIMYSIFTAAIAGFSTPDCLSALFFFLAVYFILEKPNISFMFLFFLLSVFTRVDNVIPCFFIISFLTFSKKWKSINLRQYLLMSALLGISYVCIILPVTQFGWSIFYYSHYARQIDFSRDFNQSVSFSSYLGLIQTKLVTALVSSQFIFFLFLGVLLTGNPFKSPRKLTLDQSFLLVLAAVAILRFLLLPDLSDRFYFSFYLVIIILLVRKFSTRISMVSNGNPAA